MPNAGFKQAIEFLQRFAPDVAGQEGRLTAGEVKDRIRRFVRGEFSQEDRTVFFEAICMDPAAVAIFAREIRNQGEPDAGNRPRRGKSPPADRQPEGKRPARAVNDAPPSGRNGCPDGPAPMLPPAEGRSDLQAAWRQCHSLPDSPPDLCLDLGRRILGRGDPILAYDLLSRGLASLDKNAATGGPGRELQTRLRQQLALALASSGATARAHALLAGLCAEGEETAETLGLLGRVCKDFAGQAPNARKRRERLQQARACYRRGFEQERQTAGKNPPGYYCGINAAFIEISLGNLLQARSLAAEVRQICNRHLAREDSNSNDSYWLLATLGEAELICGRPEEARRWYHAAVAKAGGRWRNLASTRRQLSALLQLLPDTSGDWNSLFPHLTVAMFTPRLSRPEGAAPRLSENQLRRWLNRETDGRILVGAHWCPASRHDLVFGEWAVEHRADMHIVLPCARTETKDLFAGDRLLQRRFEILLTKAASVAEGAARTTDPALNTTFVRSLLLGAGRLAAQRLDGHLQILDPKPASHPDADEPFHLPAPKDEPAKSHGSHAIRAMLFADVKGYSALDDPSLVRFSHSFLPRIARVLDRFKTSILTRRTAGDGLFLVLSDIEAAVGVALALSDEVAGTSWTGLGLPAELGLRISLDAGPVYCFTEPVTGRLDVCGSYANRAARIEPVTPPNLVYASETFAALYAASGGRQCRFDYVGQVSLPKEFGFSPLYCANRNETQ